MINRGVVALLLASSLLFTGCWDHTLLKEVTFVYGIGLERSEKGGLQATYVIQRVRNANQGGGEIINDSITAEGDAFYDTSLRADRKVSGMLQARTIKLLAISKELARRDIYPLLEPLLRNRAVPMTLKMALVDGDVSELMHKQKVGLQRTLEYLIRVIDNGEDFSYIPQNDLQHLSTLMFDNGRDFGLPVFKMAGDRIELSEFALFHGSKFTGVTLTIPESTLMTLLQGQKGKIALLTHRTGQNVRNVFMISLSHRMDIIEREDEIVVPVTLHMKTVLREAGKILEDQEIKQLEASLSKHFTKEAELLFQKIQKANCDLLGIGRELNAYHHHLWTKLDWNKEYPRIKIEPNVQLEIVNTGVFN